LAGHSLLLATFTTPERPPHAVALSTLDQHLCLHTRTSQGFNASMLAYGQTGSGKTYTMGTAIENMASMSKSGKGIDKSDGIIPRLITCLFGYEKAASEVYDIELKVSARTLKTDADGKGP